MIREYASIRPYPGTLGDSIASFIEELGLAPSEAMQPIAGTPDERCAQWMARSSALLFVVPFHMHRGGQREVLDGIGVLQQLPPDFAVAGRVLFMPVRDFSWSASFQRRLDDLREARPELFAHLVVAHEDELGSPSLRARLRRRIDDATLSSSGAPSRRQSVPPRATRSSGHWTFPADIFQADETRRSSLPPASSDSSLVRNPRTSEVGALRPSGDRESGELERFDITAPGSLRDALASKKS